MNKTKPARIKAQPLFKGEVAEFIQERMEALQVGPAAVVHRLVERGIQAERESMEKAG